MSNPGYGNQDGPYPPGSPYSSDPQWSGGSQPQPSSDPWGTAQPAASPYPAAPVSGAEYPVPGYSTPPEAVPPSSTPPSSSPPASSGAGYGAASPPAGPPPGVPTAPIPHVTGPISSIANTEVGPSGYGRPPTPGRSPLLVLLAAATAVLLVLGLTMTGLFIFKNNEQNDTKTKLTTAEQTVAERDKKIAALEKDNTDTKARLTTSEQQLKDAQSTLGTTNADKQVISQCLKLVIQALDAINKKDQKRLDTLSKQLDAPCDKAERLI